MQRHVAMQTTMLSSDPEPRASCHCKTCFNITVWVRALQRKSGYLHHSLHHFHFVWHIIKKTDTQTQCMLGSYSNLNSWANLHLDNDIWSQACNNTPGINTVSVPGLGLGLGGLVISGKARQYQLETSAADFSVALKLPKEAVVWALLILPFRSKGSPVASQKGSYRQQEDNGVRGPLKINKYATNWPDLKLMKEKVREKKDDFLRLWDCEYKTM